MKKHILAAGAAVLALGYVSMANAATLPCPGNTVYQHPVKAASFKAALTSAFVSCGNSGGATPNSFSETGTTPTCYPAQTLNEKAGSPPTGWLWGPKSTGSIAFKAGKNKIHTIAHPNADTNAVDLYITTKISDIHAGTGLADESLGKVSALSRATIIDRAENKLMTVIDFPTQYPIIAKKGKVNNKTSATVILNKLNNEALPACTNIELVQVIVRDVNGNAFASIGNYLP